MGEALDSGDVARIFKAISQAARLTAEEIAGISGHSTRVGAAQDMVRCGVDLVGAMQAGRWKTSAMAARYSARLLAKRAGMAQIADRRVHSDRAGAVTPNDRQSVVITVSFANLSSACRASGNVASR